MIVRNDAEAILKAVSFAAGKHRTQRRKDSDSSPYINHPIEVAEVLATVGGVTDIDILRAAVLHDTIEDTQTTASELDYVFNPAIRSMVEEVSDDKKLPKEERKRLQIEHAPHLSHGAKQIKLADHIANVRAVTQQPPKDWSLERRQQFLVWSSRVIAGVRGCNAAMERRYDELLKAGRRALALDLPILVTVPVAGVTSPDDVDTEVYCVNLTDQIMYVDVRSASFTTFDDDSGGALGHGSPRSRGLLSPGEAKRVGDVAGWEWDGAVHMKLTVRGTGEKISADYDLKAPAGQYTIDKLGKEGSVILPRVD
jgi:guanosine-3',5'-bis(diphosphate) 3'-pyrophosphohydrolase